MTWIKLKGWAGYFGFSQSNELPTLDSWIRRPLRCVVWIQWKTHPRRFHELLRLGISVSMAFASIRCRKGPRRLSITVGLNRSFTKARFRRLGLHSMGALMKT